MKEVIFINTGKIFEQEIKSSIPENCYFFRIADPPQSFTQDSSSLRFSLQNPYDCFIYSYPNFVALELKSVESSLTFYREDFVSDKSKKQAFNVKKNQIKGLQKAAEHKGAIAGLIINFRKSNHTYFIEINQFVKMTNVLTKKSFNEKDIIQNNGLLIEQKLKKVHYSYNIEKFLNEVKGE